MIKLTKNEFDHINKLLSDDQERLNLKLQTYLNLISNDVFIDLSSNYVLDKIVEHQSRIDFVKSRLLKNSILITETHGWWTILDTKREIGGSGDSKEAAEEAYKLSKHSYDLNHGINTTYETN